MGSFKWFGLKVPGTVDHRHAHNMIADLLNPMQDENVLGTFARRGAIADAVVFVSSAGSDANDGLSLGSAKATIEAAYDALPATGGMIQLGRVTVDLEATGATTGFTITPGKPCHLRGIGNRLSVVRYNGSGVGVMVGDGTEFLDWGSFEDVGVECTDHTSAVTGVSLDNAHRGYWLRASVIGGGNAAGSTAVLANDGWQNYIKDSLLYGFYDGVNLNSLCHDFSLTDTSVDGAGTVVRVGMSHNVRIQGGQISGGAVGIRVDATNASGENSYGFQLLATHCEGNDLDVAIGPNATSDRQVAAPYILTALLNGITLDRAYRPLVISNASMGSGKAVTVTANCTGAFLWVTPGAGTYSDSGVSTTYLDATGTSGKMINYLFQGAQMVATGTGSIAGFKHTGSSIGMLNNPATAAGNAFQSIVGAEANVRWSARYDGFQEWGAGGAAGTDVTISRGAAGVLKVGGSLARGLGKSTLAADGAVTFDARYGGTYIKTLNANATSSSIGSATQDGQEITIVWVQDSTGGRTYVWPTNCKFAAGTAPSDTTLSTRTGVSFRYDSTAAIWYETARAVAVPT